MEALPIKGVLDAYATAIGQLINLDKCSILFGEHYQQEDKDYVVRFLEVKNIDFEKKDLDLPTTHDIMRFKNIQERLTKHLVLWRDSQLAQSSKEVLFKAVAQALST